MNYLKLYDLERYLFEDVHCAFREKQKLSAFDFFCIIIWKANRAKSKVALKLLSRDARNRKDLTAIVEDLTTSIAKAKSDKERLRILIKDWEFRLPMASAVLTVFDPETFTVYDVRVCDQLGRHHDVQNLSRFDALWIGYESYVKDVRKQERSVSSLRDKDRTLWAKSFEKQLNGDIATLFRKDDE